MLNADARSQIHLIAFHTCTPISHFPSPTTHTQNTKHTHKHLHNIHTRYDIHSTCLVVHASHYLYIKFSVINFPGTICSGVFCLCLGIPRFSQHDGVRARIGSFVINTIVGVAQAFTLIFCLVGWGWSIWWGMIMLRASSNYKCNLFNFSHLSVSVFCIRILHGSAEHTNAYI